MEGEAPKRRRGRIQDEIPADQFRNVTFRAQASVYNALARRAAETGKSVTDVLEALVMQHLVGVEPAPPSLTAEDVRQIVREEMGRGQHAIPTITWCSACNGQFQHLCTRVECPRHWPHGGHIPGRPI